MKYKVDKNDSQKAYMQLYYQIRTDIANGAYSYGDILPSKRLLAEETGVSVITVEHALQLLCEEGYAESKERRGYFVIYKKSDFFTTNMSSVKIRTTQARHVPHRFIPFTVLSKAMRKVILDRGEELLIKSPNHGCTELRSAISAYLMRTQGISAENSQIIIGSGAEYLYSLVAQLLKDRLFAIENPCYKKIEQVYASCGVLYEKLNLEVDGINSKELNNSLATVLHVTPFNSYPSGITATVSKRTEYIDWARRRGGYIIEDNFDSELTVSSKNDDTLFAMPNDDRVFYLNTFSRTVAPSIRVGYIVLPKSLVQEFESKLGFYSCTVPLFEQYVLCELMESGDFERHINRVRRAKRKALSEKNQ